MSPDEDAGPPYAVMISVVPAKSDDRKSGEPTSAGSGLLVDSRHVVTAAHVIANAFGNRNPANDRTGLGELVLSAKAPGDRGATIRVVPGGRSSGRPAITACVVGEDRVHDLAVLKLDEPIHGVVPPAFLSGAPRSGSCRCYGFQLDKIHCFTWDKAEGARLAGPGMDVIYGQMRHGAPAGMSGGPVVQVDSAGRHLLLGLALIGGLAASESVYAGAPIIRDLLRRVVVGWTEPDFGDEEIARAGPGVMPRFDVTLPGGHAIEMCLQNRRPVMFRPSRPVAAAAIRALLDRPAILGAEHLPAHVPDLETYHAVFKAYARHAAGAGSPVLRLPSIAELTAAADTDASTVKDLGGLGLPVPLSAYPADTATGSTPPGTAEWATGPDRKPRVYVRLRDGGAIASLDEALSSGQAPSHLRHTLRPVFAPGDRL